MVSIVHKNLELIKSVNIEFYRNLELAIEMKNNPHKDLQTYIELLNQLIYVNKEIAREAFLHAENWDKHNF